MHGIPYPLCAIGEEPKPSVLVILFRVETGGCVQKLFHQPSYVV